MSTSSAMAIQPDPFLDEDDQLVVSAQENPAHFPALYNRWAVPVYQYFYHRTGEMSSAEDLTSQLFLAVYRSLPRYRHRGHFAAWLFTIARNLSREYYRKQAREVSLEMVQSLRAPSDPAAEYAQTDEIRRLVRLVHALPEGKQELIRLRYVAGLSFEDMASVLHKRVEAVKKALYRLQTRLQADLQRSSPGEESYE